MIFLVFFKQKTAYEMRISDWSSDVCSSDLAPAPGDAPLFLGLRGDEAWFAVRAADAPTVDTPRWIDLRTAAASWPAFRSEERRVGKECVSTCRSRWSP